jgi:hypothetical protein
MAVTLVTRLGLLAAMYGLTRGRELSDDSQMLWGLLREPWAMLSGASWQHSQHPPFLGAMLAIAVAPWRGWLPDMVALRLGLITWELVGVGFLVAALQRTVRTSGHLTPISSPTDRWLVWLPAMLPMGWMCSVVMAQDECVAVAWLALVLWLLAHQRWHAALWAAGGGVLAGKVFLALLAGSAVLLVPAGALWSRALRAGAPVLLVYAGLVLSARLHGAQPPLVGFHPSAEFGINAWVWAAQAGMSGEACRTWSALLTAPLLVLPVWGVWRAKYWTRPLPERSVVHEVAGLTLALWAWLFVAFYHVNPEYVALLLPCLLLVLPVYWPLTQRLQALTLVGILGVVPWMINFFFGLKVFDRRATTSGKAAFARIYDSMTSLPPALGHELAVLLCTLTLLWLAISATRRQAAKSGPRAR